MLNTRLHLPDESRTALDLFKDGFETTSYQVNAFYAHDDFVLFARRLGLVEKRFLRILKTFISQREAVFSLIDGSLLPEESKLLYKEDVNDRISAVAYALHSGDDLARQENRVPRTILS